MCISINCDLIGSKSVSKDEMFKNDHPHVPADFRMSYLASQTLQFVKASIIHHQSVVFRGIPEKMDVGATSFEIQMAHS